MAIFVSYHSDVRERVGGPDKLSKWQDIIYAQDPLRRSRLLPQL